jgi:hypothetical protein
LYALLISPIVMTITRSTCHNLRVFTLTLGFTNWAEKVGEGHSITHRIHVTKPT